MLSLPVVALMAFLSGQTLTLRAGTVEVTSPFVRLGDVAVLDGIGPQGWRGDEPGGSYPSIAATVLLTLDAGEAVITGDLVRRRLAALGIEAVISGAEYVTVRYAGGNGPAGARDAAPAADAIEALRAAALAGLASHGQNHSLKLEALNVFGEHGTVEAQSLRAPRVEAVGGADGVRWVRFTARDDAGRPLRGWARFSLLENKRAAVASAAIKRGEILASEHLELADVTVSAGRFEGFEDLNRLFGRRAARDIRQGEPLRPADVERRLAVRRGASVRLFLAGTGYALSDRAQALEDGEEGELVKVRNLRSGQVLAARVTAADTVTPVD